MQFATVILQFDMQVPICNCGHLVVRWQIQLVPDYGNGACTCVKDALYVIQL